jgi:Uma2 family endonuclease
MPTLQIEAPDRPTVLEPPRKRWTRAECEMLESYGLLDHERLELVEGELINKMGKKRPHSNAERFMFGWFLQVFGFKFILNEEPIDVAAPDNPINEPEPDIVVLNREFPTFVSSNPGPGDIRLLVEVAHSSLTFDLTTKAALYARAGIVEYWVLDVETRRLHVHRNPVSGDSFGKYQTILAYEQHESVAPLAAPEHEFPVKTAFVA